MTSHRVLLLPLLLLLLSPCVPLATRCKVPIPQILLLLIQWSAGMSQPLFVSGVIRTRFPLTVQAGGSGWRQLVVVVAMTGRIDAQGVVVLVRGIPLGVQMG